MAKNSKILKTGSY